MPPAPLPPEAEAFLRKPHFAVVATIRKDGSPYSSVTWYDYDENGLFQNLDGARVRLGHLRRDPRLSVTVFDPSNPYWQLTLLGRVTRIEDDTDFSGINRLAQRYIGSDYPDTSSPRVNTWMEVESWNGWDPVNYTVWTPGVTQPPA